MQVWDRFGPIRKGFALGIVAAAASLVAASSARADQLTLALSDVVSGSSAPSGSKPWVDAVFTSEGANTVQLTITNNMKSPESVSAFYFNVLSSIVPNTLSFTPSKGVTAGVDNSAVLSGIGKFDFEITFGTRNSAYTLGAGASATFTITGTGITAASFDATSTPTRSWDDDDKKTAWYGLAVVTGSQQYCGNQNDWIGDKKGGKTPPVYTPNVAPEPASLTMALIGLTMAGGRYVLNRRRPLKPDTPADA